MGQRAWVLRSHQGPTSQKKKKKKKKKWIIRQTKYLERKFNLLDTIPRELDFQPHVLNKHADNPDWHTDYTTSDDGKTIRVKVWTIDR